MLKIASRFGFSLVELMVVVAIIGIIAAIGIPQYSKFQAKARQSEGRTALAPLYTSEVSFFEEYNLYSVDLRNIGYGTTGSRLRYIVGFRYGTGCVNYTTGGGAPIENSSISNTTSCGANVNVFTIGQANFQALPLTHITLVNNQCTAIANPAFSLVPSTWSASSCDSTIGTQAFTAIAVGDPNSSVGDFFLDGWAIDHFKSLRNTDVGIQ